MPALLVAVALSALLAGCAAHPAEPHAPLAVPHGGLPGASQSGSQGVPQGAPAAPNLSAAPLPLGVAVPKSNPGPNNPLASNPDPVASNPMPSPPLPAPPVVEGGPVAPPSTAKANAVPPSKVAEEGPEESVEEEEEEEEQQPGCVHVPRELCPPLNELCRCVLVNGTTTGICCDVTTVLQLKESLNCQSLGSNITALHARNITLHSLDVSVLNLTKLQLPQLESLAITDGHIIEFKGNLEARNLACLNLSSNSLKLVSNNTFASLHSIQNLDLSWNDLQQLPHPNTTAPEFKLDVSGNQALRCASISGFMKIVRNLQFRHDNNTSCVQTTSFHWFNSTAEVPLSNVMLINKLEKECPRGESEPCICSLERLDLIPGKQPSYSVNVDCFNKRLTKLPATLPPNTVFMNISSNNISDLQDLSINSDYESIRYFVADDNQITSITALEGSTFMENFVALSLRSNKITSLPTYMLSNVFNRNWDDKTVRLGLNKFKCDCSTAQSVKMWLNANYKHIPDYNEVLCENMREKVFELDQHKVCAVQSDWTDYVYYLVAAEVILLILLISKVSYDYWVFKTAGYLPWPASKMPKLPCDWVFE